MGRQEIPGDGYIYGKGKMTRKRRPPNKGRHRRNLTPGEIFELKRRLAAGEKGAYIAAQLNVTEALVSMVRRGKRHGEC